MLGRVQRRVLAQPFHEIGVGDEEFAEGNQIRLALLQGVDRKIARIVVVGDIGAGKRLAQRQKIKGHIVARTARCPFDDMDIGELPGAELRSQIAEGRRWRAVDRIVGWAHRREADAYAALVPNGQNRVGHFKRESGAVLDRLAIAVGALVRPVFQELIDQIPVRAMNFDAVKAGPLGVFRRFHIVGNDAGNFRKAQGARLRCLREARTR